MMESHRKFSCVPALHDAALVVKQFSTECLYNNYILTSNYYMKS